MAGEIPKIKRMLWGELGFHIQEEIIKRLPVKSIVQYRCVCKAWKSLIDSPYFIAAHTADTVGEDQDGRRRQHLLLVSYMVGAEQRFVSIVDDESFPQHKHGWFVPPTTIPLYIKLLNRPGIVGSCNGLLCLDGYYYSDSINNLKFRKKVRAAVLWNPSIRKSIAIPVPGTSHEMDQTCIGFGVSPVTNDPIIVRIIQLAPLHEKTDEINHPRDVMVYSLSSGKWTRPSTNMLPSKSIRFSWSRIVIGRFIYWSGSHQRAIQGQIHWSWTCNLIISFDMTNHTFQVIILPDTLAHHPPRQVSISKLRESSLLKLQHYSSDEKQQLCVVWKMEEINGVFTKLFTINNKSLGSIRTLGFTITGAPIVQVDDAGKTDIAVYDPNSHLNLNHLHIYGGARLFLPVNSYKETLLLLGRSDCTSY